MPDAMRAEIYFIGSMMVLILIVSSCATYFFVKQYRREMREKRARANELKKNAHQEH